MAARNAYARYMATMEPLPSHSPERLFLFSGGTRLAWMKNVLVEVVHLRTLSFDVEPAELRAILASLKELAVYEVDDAAGAEAEGEVRLICRVIWMGEKYGTRCFVQDVRPPDPVAVPMRTKNVIRKDTSLPPPVSAPKLRSRKGK